MKYNFLVLLIILFSTCCNRSSNPFCDDIRTIDPTEPAKVKTGKIIIAGDTMPRIKDIISVGDLIVLNVDDRDAKIQFFSRDGQILGKTAKFGRAENEYTQGMSFVGQPDDRYLYLRDVNKASFTIFDTDSFKINGELSTKKTFNTFPRLINVFISPDSMLVYEHEIPGSYALTARDLATNTEIWEEKLYPPTEDPFSTYFSYMVYNDQKQKLVGAMRFMDQINFYDLKTKKRKAATLKTEDVSDANKEGYEYYCNIKANNDNIFALYMNQNAEESYDIPKKMEIHIFDWDGNFVDKYILEEYIIRIAVEQDGTLYGKDLNGNIYRYDLN